MFCPAVGTVNHHLAGAGEFSTGTLGNFQPALTHDPFKRKVHRGHARARALGVRLLFGGYGQEELERAGAYPVYQDPQDLLVHLDEVGVGAVE